MRMTLFASIYQGLAEALVSMGKLAFIILPLMIIVELAKQYGWLEILSRQTKWFTKTFHLPETAALPAFVGLLFGIVSGSGIILQTAKEEHYSRATLTVLFVMVGICHSLFEETALFVGLDVNILVVAGGRLITALLFAYAIGQINWKYNL